MVYNDNDLPPTGKLHSAWGHSARDDAFDGDSIFIGKTSLELIWLKNAIFEL